VGMEKSLEKMRSADLVLYIYDINEMDAAALAILEEELRKAGKKYLLAANKVDKLAAAVQASAGHLHTYYISAKNKTGIEAVKTALFNSVIDEQAAAESTVVTNTRHFEALKKLTQSLRDVRAGLDNGVTADLLALDVRVCLHYISEITGDISNEDVLDFIFSKFCIGK